MSATFLDTYTYTLAGTLACIVYYFLTAMIVGNARYKYKVKAPATTGSIEFEKRYRVQMNALENIVVRFVLWCTPMMCTCRSFCESYADNLFLNITDYDPCHVDLRVAWLR